ncbi:MAG: DUF1573 domain-containing protein [Chitinophagaceae bacterium]|nr:DUF1573 domain-containing protein [Chitinophagaceae bacterium]
MKKILLLATAFAFTLGVKAQSPSADALIKVNVESHDFGKILQNNPVVFSFEIKNISDKPVVVENTWASCGCTTPEKIVDPILPGKTVSLKVNYNAAAAAPFSKDVFIKLAGIDQPKTVKITGEVLTAEAFEQYKKGGAPATDKKDIPVAEKKTGVIGPNKTKATN